MSRGLSCGVVTLVLDMRGPATERVRTAVEGSRPSNLRTGGCANAGSCVRLREEILRSRARSTNDVHSKFNESEADVLDLFDCRTTTERSNLPSPPVHHTAMLGIGTASRRSDE